MRRLAFVSTLTVVWVHSFNLNERYLWPGYNLAGAISFNHFFQLLICNSLFRFAIPLFFMISGYLMAHREGKLPYGEMVAKRAKMLLGPYFSWAIIGLAFTYLWEAIPELNPITDLSHLRPFYDKHLHNFNLTEWLQALTILPVSFQLWFLRSLFIYSVIYPALAWAIERKPIIYFCVAGLLWLVSGDLFVVGGDGLLYFGFGIFLRKKEVDLGKLSHFLYSPIFYILAIALAFGHTALAFANPEWAMTAGYFVYKIMQPALLIAIWTFYDKLNFNTQITHFDKLSVTNFFIYGAHVPAVYFITDWVFEHYGRTDEIRLSLFLLLPAVVILVASTTGLLLRKVWPAAFALLSGWRKFNMQPTAVPKI